MGYFPRNYCFKVVVPLSAGTVLGAYLLTVMPDDTFRKYFAFFMVLMTLVTFLKPVSKEQRPDVEFTAKSLTVNYIIYFFIGIYIGFIQAGVGFMIIAASVISGLGMVRANAVKMFLNFGTATISLAIFIYAGKVLLFAGSCHGCRYVFFCGYSIRYECEGERSFSEKACVRCYSYFCSPSSGDQISFTASSKFRLSL